MEKKMLIALVLSLVVLFAFQQMNKKPPNPIGEYAIEDQQAKDVSDNQALGMSGLGELSAGGTNDVKNIQENEITIETEQYEILFSDIGGSVKKWRLKKFENKELDNIEEVLIKEQPIEKRLFAMKSPAVAGLSGKRFQVRKETGFLEFTYESPGNMRVSKKYVFQNGADHIGLEINIENISTMDKNVSYALIGPSGVTDSGGVKGRSFLEADIKTASGVVKKKSVKGAWTENGNISWVAIKNRYFAVILKPFSDPVSAEIQGDSKEGFITAMNSKMYILAPGTIQKDEYLLYAGPMDEKQLMALGYNFEETIDYGWFGGISKVLLVVLRVLHSGVKNWGAAIILLTILVNLVSFPLTKKSFVSMHRMKNIQPHMQKLKELHKDNPQKLNKEMMELYKKYNVNPFGGCLPMLLQIPIFIALYQGLIKAVELKGAHFLWVKDLSRPDAVHIPFTLPMLGSHINILPLLMVVMMFAQQKIQGVAAASMTPEQAGQQKMMLLMMPVFFGFLFYNMPSGLVLYWLTNTILMTSEQLFLKRTMD
ncbi:MAG: membrane protein insertase YidC [Candidatus Omnitrophica bacterium]|nr:membrane protein insertase YidC [Candidatus Omnitrophota bacterium]MBU1128716.1 membrane protein insertase YidC [Candidatus Omnitrophota bacterium]MBU1784831.1 membrane protein insertase YidC [Candidatus Omnitrophota bacterium]MBU1850995.1 membrane protein insertase YidC [Candidatus Omnitrophota bacterium]